MAKRIKFFLDIDDTKNYLEALSQENKIYFYSNVVHRNGELVAMEYLDIPHIGVNNSGNHTSEFYIVLDQTIPIHFRKIENGESVSFSIDQYDNPDSIVYRPGGRFDENRIMIGEISTISNSPMSLQLMSVFEKHLKKECKKVHGYYVSKQILDQKNLRLITMHINQDELYDFKIV